MVGVDLVVFVRIIGRTLCECYYGQAFKDELSGCSHCTTCRWFGTAYVCDCGALIEQPVLVDILFCPGV